MHLRIAVIRRKISQKLVRHCNFAVPKTRPQCQPNNGHVTSSVKYTCVAHTHTSDFPHVASSNWRLDFYKFKKLSSAEVLKCAINNERVNSSKHFTPLKNTTFVPVSKPNAYKVCTKTEPLLVHSHVVKTKAYHKGTKI